MPLSEALDIRPGDVVCFVGAGGKTAASIQLARELSLRGRRTLITTTTKIIEPVLKEDERLVVSAELDEATAGAQAAFGDAHIVCLASRRLAETVGDLEWLGSDYPWTLRSTKLAGIPPEWVGPLAQRAGADVTLVEADGAAHRLLKAPAAHEPVIPDVATLVVPMADLDALGKPLNDEVVHRPLLLADLAGVSVGSPISPEIIAIALAHPLGGLKSVPAGARVVPLLTTHSPTLDFANAARTARSLLLSPSIRRAVVAYLRSTPVTVQVFMT
jgi:molybdenum cofactor cytidylyltransferase